MASRALTCLGGVGIKTRLMQIHREAGTGWSGLSNGETAASTVEAQHGFYRDLKRGTDRQSYCIQLNQDTAGLKSRFS